MSLWRRRKLDRELADRKLEAVDEQLVDLAVRRARLEAEVALYVLQPRKKGA